MLGDERGAGTPHPVRPPATTRVHGRVQPVVAGTAAAFATARPHVTIQRRQSAVAGADGRVLHGLTIHVARCRTGLPMATAIAGAGFPQEQGSPCDLAAFGGQSPELASRYRAN